MDISTHGAYISRWKFSKPHIPAVLQYKSASDAMTSTKRRASQSFPHFQEPKPVPYPPWVHIVTLPTMASSIILLFAVPTISPVLLPILLPILFPSFSPYLSPSFSPFLFPSFGPYFPPFLSSSSSLSPCSSPCLSPCLSSSYPA